MIENLGDTIHDDFIFQFQFFGLLELYKIKRMIFFLFHDAIKTYCGYVIYENMKHVYGNVDHVNVDVKIQMLIFLETNVTQ